MSNRTVIEVNHDYIYDLERQGHISKELSQALTGSERELKDCFNHHNRFSGIRFLGRRHHSETLKLKVV